VAGAVLAVLAVTVPSLWRWTRALVTMAHEGGHAVAALTAGRRLAGIRLHSDTSGLTVSRGRPAGAGMVMTLLAGYPAPSVIGVLAALVIAWGRPSLAIAAAAALLVVMLLAIRNVVGFVAVLVTAALLVGLSAYAPPVTRSFVAHALVWVLLLGAVRAVGDLHATRRRMPGPSSDADQLARLSGVPALLWVALFALLSLAGLAAGGWLLVGVIAGPPSLPG